MASYLHHTATTLYPCCVPTLGDSKGASCVGLAAAKIHSIFIFCNVLPRKNVGFLQLSDLKMIKIILNFNQSSYHFKNPEFMNGILIFAFQNLIQFEVFRRTFIFR